MHSPFKWPKIMQVVREINSGARKTKGGHQAKQIYNHTIVTFSLTNRMRYGRYIQVQCIHPHTQSTEWVQHTYVRTHARTTELHTVRWSSRTHAHTRTYTHANTHKRGREVMCYYCVLCNFCLGAIYTGCVLVKGLCTLDPRMCC